MKGKSSTKKSSSARRVPRSTCLGKGQNGETNRRAAIVLEVLAGMRTPSEAASALGLSVNYYYVLERKALRGLLAACEPQPKGPPGPGLERQLARLEKELTKCRQECLRQASLVRAAERAFGLPSSTKPSRPNKSSSENGSPKRKRRRRPTVRAMRAAESLRKNSSLDNPPSEVEQSLDGSVDSMCVATDKERGDVAQRPQSRSERRTLIISTVRPWRSNVWS